MSAGQPLEPRVTALELRSDGVERHLGEIKADARSLRESQEAGFREARESREAGFREARESWEAGFREARESREALRIELGGRIDKLLYLTLGSWLTIVLAIFFHR